MIPEEAKKKHRLTQEDCDTARLLLARRRTLKEIADIIGVDPSTVGKIRVADYNLEKYLAQRKEMNRKTKERKAAAEAGRRKELMNKLGPFDYANQGILEEVKPKDGATPPKPFKRFSTCPPYAKWLMGEEPKYMPPAEEVPGQMQMQLDPPAEEAKQDDTKLMRFQAAMMDRLIRKLDELIGALKGGGKDE